MELLGFNLRLWAVHKDSSLELSVCSVPETHPESSLCCGRPCGLSFIWRSGSLQELPWCTFSVPVSVLGGSCWSPVLPEVDDEHLMAQLEELCARALAGDAAFPLDSFTRTGIQPFPSVQKLSNSLCLPSFRMHLRSSVWEITPYNLLCTFYF